MIAQPMGLPLCTCFTHKYFDVTLLVTHDNGFHTMQEVNTDRVQELSAQRHLDARDLKVKLYKRTDSHIPVVLASSLVKQSRLTLVLL